MAVDCAEMGSLMLVPRDSLLLGDIFVVSSFSLPLM